MLLRVEGAPDRYYRMGSGITEGDNMDGEEFPPLSVRAVALDYGDADFELRGDAVAQLKDRVEFGGPIVTPIDEKYKPDDSDLQAFVQGMKGKWRFALAHMSINFPPSRQSPLTQAAVQVTLGDATGTEEVAAYSLHPTRAGDSYEANRGYTISPSLTVGPVTASAGTLTHNSTDHGTRDYVIGGPELSPHPSWIFQATPAQPMYGSTRLIMVVQIPVGATASVAVALSAEVEEGRFRKQQIPLPGAPADQPGVVIF